MTYAEFLKTQGASEEDVKLLDTAIGRRAFDAQVAAIATATASAAASDKAKRDYEASVETWHTDQILPAYQRMEQESITAKAELARAKAVLLSAQDAGLLKIAADMGFKPDGTPTPPANGTPPVDTSKFVTQERLNELAETAGNGLAVLQDIVMEHAQLFPDRPLKVRELRAAAVAARKTVEQYWSETYGVSAAREKRDADAKSAYEARLRKEGADAATQALADRYGNPDTRPLVPSISPLAPRADGSGRDKMPWESNDRSNDRVRKATAAVINQQGQPGAGTGRTN